VVNTEDSQLKGRGFESRHRLHSLKTIKQMLPNMVNTHSTSFKIKNIQSVFSINKIEVQCSIQKMQMNV
jgi:hypothetical protein